MKCRQVKNRLSAYLDGELISSSRQAISDHLRDCGACALMVDRLRQLDRQMAEAPIVPPDPYFITRLRAELAARNLASRRPGLNPWIQRALIPATVVLGLFIGAQLGIELNQGWSDARYGDLESQAFSELQNSVAESYLSLNGWTEVKDEE